MKKNNFKVSHYGIIAGLLFLGMVNYAADVLPKRIVLSLTATPCTSQAVTWRTDTIVIGPRAQIVPAVGSPELETGAVTLFAKTESVKIDSINTVYHHSIVFDSLIANTLYAYRVGDSNEDHWSEWNQFRTADSVNAPFQFVFLGDPQNEIKSVCSRLFRAAYQEAPDARFWICTGDLVSNSDRDEEWGELFYGLGWIPRMTPMVMATGNHGYLKVEINGKSTKILSPLWRPHFTQPENGPDSLDETAYAFDYQGARFVVLNGNQNLKVQAKWLDKLLSENTQIWTIVSIHQPFYSTGRKRNEKQLRKLFVPIIDKYAVDLVLQGHDHAYGRTYKLYDSKRVDDDASGTVYVVSVSGAKMYEINPNFEKLMVKLENGLQLFQVIEVSDHVLKYQSFTATGELFDAFELRK